MFEAQLGFDVFPVGFHRLDPDTQSLSDLPRLVAKTDEVKYLQLSVG